jgi:UrcA family protein
LRFGGVQTVTRGLVIKVPIVQSPIHQEINMYTKSAALHALAVLGATAVMCTLIAGKVTAGDRDVTVAIPVNSQGLDLSQPAGAHQLYMRLKDAAYVACTRANRAGLAPSADPFACYEKALGDAVRSVNVPLLTQAYLATHTLREAMAHGIDVPAQMAAK